MKRLALNFICKNESHIITTMLNSVKPFTDLIVAADTGSDDDTIAIIQNFGEINNIPTYVYERSFDNFCNSRNFALEKLLEVVDSLTWAREETWGFWIDCDEIAVVSEEFSKDGVQRDIYFITSIAEGTRYFKQFFFSLDKSFNWVGPIHEYMKYDENLLTADIVKGITITYGLEGASWKGDLEKKFINYAKLLKDYIDEGHYSFRWLSYLAKSYGEAATSCGDEIRKKDYLLLALKYYNETAQLDKNAMNKNERYDTLINMSRTKKELKLSTIEIKSDLLKAHFYDDRFADPIQMITDIYISKSRYNTAKIYSYYSVSNYHQQEPKDDDVIEVNTSLYTWQLLYQHYFINLNLDHSEVKSLYKKLTDIISEQRNVIDEKAIQAIEQNSPKQINKRIMSRPFVQFFNNIRFHKQC